MSTVIPPPPCYQERAVTLSLPRHTYEFARWAYRYERATGGLLHPGRSFADFLVDYLEHALETPLARWEHEQESARRVRTTSTDPDSMDPDSIDPDSIV